MTVFNLDIDVTFTVRIPVEAETMEEANKKGYNDSNIISYLKSNSNIMNTYLTCVSDDETGEILEDYNKK